MEKNIITLANALTQITGLYVSPEHIHQSSRRYYYIPEAKANHPLFLHHYRGPFFVDLPKEDFDKIVSGEITPEEYIENANWCFGYYWGGGSMVSGGYFTPMDIHDKEKVLRYMRILACTGCARVSGYRPTEERCSTCELDTCPFSQFKEHSSADEFNLPDDRLVLFEALNQLIQDKYGYKLHGMSSSDTLAYNEVMLSPNYSEETFQLVISDELAFDLLAHPKTTDFGWREFSQTLKTYLAKHFSTEKILVETAEDFKLGMEKFEIFKPMVIRTETENNPEPEQRVTVFSRLFGVFKR